MKLINASEFHLLCSMQHFERRVLLWVINEVFDL